MKGSVTKTVLITGSSRGIGKATAEKFLAEGWRVIGTSTSGKSLLKSPNLEIKKLDLLNPESIHRIAVALQKSGYKIDVLVNNAAVAVRLENTVDIRTLRTTLEVNLIGLINLTERLLPLISKGGVIVNLSSRLGSITDYVVSNLPSYQISKAGLNIYTRSLAARLKDRGITVSSIDPGLVKTDMGGRNAVREVWEPAEEIYKLATSRVESGLFWRSGKKRAW